MLPGSVRSTQWLPLGIAFSAGGVDAGGEFFDTSFSVHAGAITLFDALTSAASPCDGGIGTISARNPALATSPDLGFWSLRRASETWTVSRKLQLPSCALHRRENIHAAGEASPADRLNFQLTYS